jgi:beta-1,4-mannosyl-glycoprotein beta-1,4-N-acetylglucosaminyltransferase
MIYDCFAFFNELDLLEIRLNELDKVVDKFVLVEATRTFQKAPKPLYFAENKERFAKFLPKIEHVVVDFYPSFFRKFRVPTPWDYDNHQKEQILLGLKNAKPTDVIIISDLDEIPKASDVAKYAHTPGIKVFEQRLYYYYLNCQCNHFNTNGNHYIAQYNRDNIGYWRGTVMCNFKDVKSVKLTRRYRDQLSDRHVIVPDSGWHFSYLGGVEKIIDKLEAYTHHEHNTDHYKNRAFIEQSINEGKSIYDPITTFEVIPVNEVLPLWVGENQERMKHLIRTI